VRTIDINDTGALVASPEALSPKFGVVLANPSSGKRASGWVVRCATSDMPGTFGPGGENWMLTRTGKDRYEAQETGFAGAHGTATVNESDFRLDFAFSGGSQGRK
jgi:hypothetical protein